MELILVNGVKGSQVSVFSLCISSWLVPLWRRLSFPRYSNINFFPRLRFLCLSPEWLKMVRAPKPGHFCSMWDSSSDYPWSTETFSGLRCGLRLFLPDRPSASRSCQTCTVVWRLSLPPPSLSSTGISPSQHLACLILSWHLLLGQILEWERESYFSVEVTQGWAKFREKETR